MEIDLQEEKELLEQRKAKFQPMWWRSFYLIGSVLALMTLLFAFGVIPRLKLQETLTAHSSSSILPQVKLLEVKSTLQPIELTLPSTLDAIHSTPIWSRVNGYIKDFLVDIGDNVKTGARLAEIETPELDQQYQQAIARFASAQAQYSIAKITAERTQGLYRENPEAISEQEVDRNVANFEAAQGTLQAARADKMRLEQIMDFKYILAPFDGIIVERNIDIGSLVTDGSIHQRQQLFKIARTDIMRVFVKVPQRFFRSIKEGITTDVQMNEFPEKIFKGVIARTTKALDPIARTLLTEIHIPNPTHELYVGLYADVKFHLAPANSYFLLPTSAVIIRADGPKVALLENDLVNYRKVKLGFDHGKMMEITGGLEEGDHVILNPSDKITEGIAVEVIETPLIKSF